MNLYGLVFQVRSISEYDNERRSIRLHYEAESVEEPLLFGELELHFNVESGREIVLGQRFSIDVIQEDAFLKRKEDG